MQPMGLIACSLFVASAVTAAASATVSRHQISSEVLRVKLASPNRVPLAENEIKSALSGKVLLLDEPTALAPNVYLEVILEGGCAPVEKFYPDGKWERSVCARAYRVERGRWSIRTDRFGSTICTALEGQKSDCRAVWKRASPNSLILTVTGRCLSGDPEFNPYRTKPL